MNRIVRGLMVNIGAAAAGSLVATVVMTALDDPVVPAPYWERLGMALIALPFTLFGCLFVLTPTYIWHPKTVNERLQYLSTGLAGAVGGAAVMGLLFAFDLKASAIGSIYGLITALVWIGLHRATGALPETD